MEIKSWIKGKKIDDYINYLLVAYAFSVPISRAGIIFFTILIFILWIVEGDLKNKFALILKNKFFLAIFALTFYMLLTLLWTNNIELGIYNFKRFWYYFIIFVIFTSLKKGYIKYLIFAFLLSMFISQIISYGIFFELWSFKRGSPDNPTPFMYHLEYSLFLAMTALILINKLILSKKFKERFFLATLSIITIITLFISIGRIGQLAFIIALFVLLIIHIKSKIKALILFTIFSISILSIAYNSSKIFQQRVNLSMSDLTKIMEDKDYGSSWGFRISTWIVTAQILQNNPFGVGIGDIRDEYIKIVQSDKDIKNPSIIDLKIGGYHSDLLEVTAGGGYIALILFCAVFYQLLFIPTTDIEIRNIKIMIFTIFTVGLIADLFLRLQFTMALFALFVGISLNSSKNR